MIRSSLGAILLLTVALLLGNSRAVVAAESYDNCAGFVTSLPAVISTPGTWCLKQDLNTSMTGGNAIELQANDVTLDCNHFKLNGTAAGITTMATGVYSSYYTYQTIRHCDIRGFRIGVQLNGKTPTGGHHTIEDNRLDGETWMGLRVEGDNSVVRRNLVSNIGGLTDTSHAFGIYTGYTVDILDNTVSGLTAGTGGNGNAYGITAGGPGRIVGNRVRGLKKGTGPVPGTTYGINSGSGYRDFIRGNQLTGDSSSGSRGLVCSGNESSARDNVITGFASAIVNCTNSGGNISGP